MLIRLKDNPYDQSGNPNFAPGKMVEVEEISVEDYFPVVIDGMPLRSHEYEIIEPLTEERVREIVREELADLDNSPRALVTFVLPDDLVDMIECHGSANVASMMRAWARGLAEDGRAYTPQILRAIADELD